MNFIWLLKHPLAINKPKSISSAQSLRDLQQAFNPSNFFAPWLEAERRRIVEDSNNRKESKWRRRQKIGVKIGHGGTLDPMATGVLIVGLGKGTKSLQNFLGCTKTYEATIIFGAATDTYDTLGKVLSKAPYDHLTQKIVEQALERFRGKIMQKPPLYSALHVQGKRLYEYAREGKELPVEIEERPVEVEEIQVVEWLPGGSHRYYWPAQEAGREDKIIAEKLLHFDESSRSEREGKSVETNQGASGTKRKRSIDDSAVVEYSDAPPAKRPGADEQPLMSGALQTAEDTKVGLAESQRINAKDPKGSKDEHMAGGHTPPAVKLRMTVASGFYVRSLAHDLGKLVGSLGCMSDLVRTRQENFKLGENVMDMNDIAKGEAVWAPKLRAMLGAWQSRAERPNGGPASGIADEVTELSVNGEASLS